MPNPEKIKISVIIPCFNEEKFLPSLFDALTKLSTAKNTYEVIIVDNGSSDRSVDIAKEQSAKVLIVPDANISELRNIGAQNADGDIFSFMDADCLPLPEWLDEASKYKEKPDVGLFGCIPACPEDGTWVEKAWIGVSPKGIKNVNFICTANMHIKKDVFEKVGGFDESLITGEDYDICQRILKAGYKIVQDDKVAVVHLRYPKTIIDRFKKEIWYGKEMSDILKVKPLYKPFWVSLVFGFSFIINIMCILTMNFGLLFYISLSLFFSLPALSAAFKVIKSKKYEKYFPLSLLYFIYLAGRFCAIIINYRSFFNKTR